MHAAMSIILFIPYLIGCYGKYIEKYHNHIRIAASLSDIVVKKSDYLWTNIRSMRHFGAIMVLILLLAMPSGMMAQQKRIYKCYIERDMVTWRGVVDSLRALPNQSLVMREQSLNYLYGYVAWTLSVLDTHRDVSKQYLQYAFDDLDEYERLGGRKARVEAYRSAFVAFDMKLHPMKIPFIGLKSVNNAKQALKSDSLDYFPKIQYGNVMYYMPQGLGGSKIRAIESYKTAQIIMERQNVWKNNWMYMNLLLTIADAFKGMELYDDVQEYYDKVLEVEPSFVWVRDTLVPNLKKKRNLE